jgi:hypothetical protein
MIKFVFYEQLIIQALANELSLIDISRHGQTCGIRKLNGVNY